MRKSFLFYCTHHESIEVLGFIFLLHLLLYWTFLCVNWIIIENINEEIWIRLCVYSFSSLALSNESHSAREWTCHSEVRALIVGILCPLRKELFCLTPVPWLIFDPLATRPHDPHRQPGRHTRAGTSSRSKKTSCEMFSQWQFFILFFQLY